MSRSIFARYTDPLDVIWTNAAHAMGLSVRRTSDAYASTDGHGTLLLSDAKGMDPDDCLAQMILHEICHWMVQGVQSLGWVDWGLDNEGTVDREREHACLRLQAALLDPYGLRGVLAPTTDFRSYYDKLPRDPFMESAASERESITRARAAYARRHHRPFREILESALDKTATIFALVTETKTVRSVLGEIAYSKTPRLAQHAVGLPMYPEPGSTCGDCAWYFESGKTKKGKCRQANGRHTRSEYAACCHFESSFDCLNCGACCREAYDTVEVGPRDPASKRHIHLLVERSDGYDMARSGSRCCCLRGGLELTPPRPTISGGTAPDDAGSDVPPLNLAQGAPFTCSIYETRPRTCRDFSIFSEHCLHARRRVGLSR